MKPQIKQAKNGYWVADGRQRFTTRNWIVRYGDMMLVYDSFDRAVTGLVYLSSEFMVVPNGLVSFQIDPT